MKMSVAKKSFQEIFVKIFTFYAWNFFSCHDFFMYETIRLKDLSVNNIYFARTFAHTFLRQDVAEVS